ncbi:MAG: c-type cytochrome, partial [Candidatus Competibacteraceae bacterium]|nr:c-type cytochrome [Candidatus Competibacteraceae bacterium]
MSPPFPCTATFAPPQLTTGWGILWLLTLLLMAIPATTGASTPEEIALGRRIVLGETDAPRCARCHGQWGQGGRAEAAPRLAGQARFYLEKQLEDFALGLRPSDKMTAIARQLSPRQRAAVAAYFAAQRQVPYPARPVGKPALLMVGGLLSAAGSRERDIRPCAECHADSGAGVPPSFPYRAGQFADYTAAQLLAWKQGRRRNDPLEVMADIAAKLTEEEIQGLALY